MKARNPQTGNFENVYVKALDSMPVGTQVDFDGTSANIPTGWEEVNNVLYESTSGTTSDISLSDDINNYSYIEIVAINKDETSETFNIFKFDTSFTTYVMNGSSVSSNGFSVFMKKYTKGTNQLTASAGRLYTGSSASNYEVFKVIKVIGYK